MHLQEIHAAYPKDAVQVVFVVSEAAVYLRASILPLFKQRLKVDYLGLDDFRNEVVASYGLKKDSSVAKNIIVDRDGNVRLVGEFTPRAEMEAVLDKLLGKPADLDLSTPEAAREALRSPESYARWKAARALGLMGDKAAAAQLAAALEDASGSVRECAADALGALGDPAAGEALLARLKDPSRAVRCAVIGALGRIGYAPAARALRAALEDEAVCIRVAAMEALGKLGDAQSAGAFLAALEDPCGDVREAAVTALGALKEPRAVPPLVDLLLGRKPSVMAASALAALGRREAVEQAIEKALAAKQKGGAERTTNVSAAVIYMGLGDACLEAKAYDDGIAWCEKALALGVAEWMERTLRAHLGEIHLAKGDVDKALVQYDLANADVLKKIAEGTAKASMYNSMSWFYVQRKVREAEALALAKKAVKLEPDEINFRDTLGWAYVRNDDAGNALLTFGEVFARDRDFDSSWEGVAELAKSPAHRAKVAKFCEALAAKHPRDEQVKRRTAEVKKLLETAKTGRF
ncbi:MAG TPA: HEAT repeat domain-containing protein [Planctomycetota bacterium]|nr:HEAT repeat domain-containing protein [Planctomycetota bacterium]OQC21268.1 MAG: putative phycocyanin operon protein Z [Planctomycetes bacterium ADurb.Bin069]HNR99201.1 HEAT repeat domain-containing protein [Planctomycetota bacterium]HNU25274.1 HEAT repeat domain-containing protein [Planctomycetota bacterium]HOE31044.1 HEAT repeat domain-containing protein [Planctomycetota bacterium]